MQQPKKWIWENPKYPEFPYSKEKLEPLIREIVYLKGKLDGTFLFLSPEKLDEIEIVNMTEEIIDNSRIEGEYLRRKSVRDSVAKAINTRYASLVDHSTRHTDALVDLLMDSRKNDAPLTIERLHGWHNALFSHTAGRGDGVRRINIGNFRDYDDMKVVENSFGRAGAIVKYIAPPHKTINKDMLSLIEYCNNSTENPYIKSALVHLWFVSIHPYDDGNGRISRALADHILSFDSKEEYKAYSNSTAIYSDRVGYYEILDRSTNLHKNRDYDFTYWLEWNMNTLRNAMKKSLKDIEFIIKNAKFWDRHRDDNLNSRQLKVVSQLIDTLAKGDNTEISTRVYKKIVDTTRLTASRDIKKLVELGCLKKVDGKEGRSTSYKIIFE